MPKLRWGSTSLGDTPQTVILLLEQLNAGFALSSPRSNRRILRSNVPAEAGRLRALTQITAIIAPVHHMIGMIQLAEATLPVGYELPITVTTARAHHIRGGGAPFVRRRKTNAIIERVHTRQHKQRCKHTSANTASTMRRRRNSKPHGRRMYNLAGLTTNARAEKDTCPLVAEMP